jgi:hypothetical protein
VDLVQIRKMAASNLMFEDKLDGESNFLSWKARVTLLLKEHDLWEIIEKVFPQLKNETLKEAHEKDIKSHRVIMDALKDHLIIRLAEEQLVKKNFKTLVDFFQSDNMNMKMILKNKIKSIGPSRCQSLIMLPTMIDKGTLH